GGLRHAGGDGAGVAQRHRRLEPHRAQGRATSDAHRITGCRRGRARPHPASASRFMKFTGELTVQAPRAARFPPLRRACFFASCVDGVRDLAEVGPDRYSAVFETRVAYMKFTFKVAVEVVRAEAPNVIEAKVEGSPLGVVGRMTATSLTTLSDADGGTKIDYAVDAALTGKLGSLGQPVLRSKAREMEKQFAAKLAAAFNAEGSKAAQP